MHIHHPLCFPPLYKSRSRANVADDLSGVREPSDVCENVDAPGSFSMSRNEKREKKTRTMICRHRQTITDTHQCQVQSFNKRRLNFLFKNTTTNIVPWTCCMYIIIFLTCFVQKQISLNHHLNQILWIIIYFFPLPYHQWCWIPLFLCEHIHFTHHPGYV